MSMIVLNLFESQHRFIAITQVVSKIGATFLQVFTDKFMFIIELRWQVENII